MITCNGIVGLALLVGSLQPGVASFKPEGTAPALATVATFAGAVFSVVGLAKLESPAIDGAVAAIDAPPSAVGVMIALLVLLPETLASVRQRSARPSADQPQPGLRLGYGQHRAHHPHYRRCINPAARPACTGADATQIVLLVLTVAVGALAAPLGRAALLQSGGPAGIFASFLFLAVRPLSGRTPASRRPCAPTQRGAR